jgi:hypothetical protein
VAEGVTDYLVLNAAIEAILGERPFTLNLLQPEQSVAFVGAGDAGRLGGGWSGVWKWCKLAAERGDGRLQNDPIFLNYDLLILHLDADVADEMPVPEVPGLPCAQPCPPASASTDALRHVLLAWVGETVVPPQTVLCTPSKSTEAWVMAACFPGDKVMQKYGWECYLKPETRLGQQAKSVRFGKNQADYQAQQATLKINWVHVVARLTEAQRFQTALLSLL